MARSVVFRATAEEDQQRLYDFICERRGEPVTAISFLRRVRGFCESLAIFPERGRKRDDVEPGVRVIPFDRHCVVCFEVEAERVVIVRIFYGGRDYERIMRRF